MLLFDEVEVEIFWVEMEILTLGILVQIQIDINFHQIGLLMERLQ